MAHDKHSDLPDESDASTPIEPTGADLTDENLSEGLAVDVDPADAPELTESAEIVDDEAGDGYVDDPATDDVNEAKLDRATDEVSEEPTIAAGSTAQRRPRSTRPTRRTPKAETAPAVVEAEGAEPEVASEEPADSLEPTPVDARRRTVVKKDRPTPKQSRSTAETDRRTTPAAFVGEAVGELRKVVWPTATQVQQYFLVVLVFVLFIIAFVSLLDLGLGWALLKVFG